MASVNKKQAIYTHEGAKARHITPLQELERSVMSCMLWEDGFYESGQTIAERIASLCVKLSADDILNTAIKAKNEMRLRHVPLLLVREAFKHKHARKQCGDVLESLISRPDDITEFVSLYWKDGKEPLAKQAKLALGRAFHKFDEYQLAKYNGGSKAVKLTDVLRMVHPEPSDLLGKLRRDELTTPQTWEVELSKGGDKKEAWTKLLLEKKVGGLAMLRNLRNMCDANVDSLLIKASIQNINAGRLLPINFISAAIHNPSLEPQIEEKFFECFKKEKAAGSTVVLVDVSGSMDWQLAGRSKMKCSDVAASLAMIARETFNDVRIFSFSDEIKEIPARHGFAIKDSLDKQSRGGTRLGAAIGTVLSVAKPERLIVITDEQSSDKVPDFSGYLINVSSNRNGVGYGQCVHIDGWSDKVIDYILEYEKSGK